PLPDLIIPTIGTLLFVASLIPGYLDGKAIKQNDIRGLILWTALQSLLEAAFIGVLCYHLTTLTFSWSDNAYASIYWIAIFVTLLFTVGTVLEGVYVIVQTYRGQYNSERHWAIEVDGLTDLVGVGQWILVYLTLFIYP